MFLNSYRIYCVEFGQLTSDYQFNLMKTNGTSAVFLILAHLELCSTGFEQLKVRL